MMIRKEKHFLDYYAEKVKHPKGRVVAFYPGDPVSKVLIKSRFNAYDSYYEVWTWDERKGEVTFKVGQLTAIEAFEKLRVVWKPTDQKMLVIHWRETEEFECCLAPTDRTVWVKGEKALRRAFDVGRICPKGSFLDFITVLYQCIMDDRYYDDKEPGNEQLGESFDAWIID